MMEERCMSTYIISDVHGDLKKFKAALEKVKFNIANDELYIIGDLIDKGNYSIELIKLVMANDECIHLLQGNHEFFLMSYLDGTISERTYISYGGGKTLDQVKKLTDNEKCEILTFLKGLEVYKVLTKTTGKYLLTHSGLDLDNICWLNENTISVRDSIELACRKHKLKYLLSTDIHYMSHVKLKKLDHHLIVGHIPCQELNENADYTVYNGVNYTCIDSGSGTYFKNRKLAVYDLENELIYYL